MSKSPVPAAFHLSGLGTDYAIYVDLPEGSKPDAGEPWITVLCLDGDDQFADLCKARKVVAKTHALPPLLLVGIGYGASYGKPGNKRSRDYTPVAITEAPDAGGADAFLEFLTGTVWTELARRYPVHPEIRGIAGYSLSGLLALHALFKPQPFFNRVLAASPSIWWGERAVLAPLVVLQDRDEALPARLFLSVGLKDSQSMTGDLDLLEAQLAARPVRELTVSGARFPECNHFNAIAVSFRTGLVELFAG
ncbi:alpha/beta hydrolase [Rariglobus hedericola]|uniref:Alpha/beta hydrolase n=1 Tax=Rariglobus hedericola TaxID=2597822 RepID=A0A556QRS3_9BACT|nr:alpha/beta hydrolase-fold protein [Rariglobus hedericola]TSJ79347.1 alpha/beta hydrolase [Rariglobus hedericola]